MSEINFKESTEEIPISDEMPERSRLSIEFAQPTSIDIITFMVENISAMQLIGLGEYLNWLGETMLAEARIKTQILEEQENTPSIITPDTDVRDLLGMS